MNTFPFLTVLALLPLVGSLLLIGVKGAAAKSVSLVVSLLTLVVAVVIAARYSVGGGMQFVEQVSWIKALGAYYALGLDGIGLTLVILVVIVTPVVILASWNDLDGDQPGSPGATSSSGASVAPKYDARLFFALVLAVESCALYLFLATDVFLFYVFFEVILVPMYFLIGGFGGARRAYAASKFLIFGLLGGFVMLASVIGLYVLSARAGQPTYLLSDLMRFVAYTSISHFGFIVLGIFAFTSQSLTGSTLYMLNHGLSTAALFLVAGYLIKRRGSRDIADFGGVAKVAPVLAGLMLFAGLSTLSLPGLSSFVSEFMVLAGTFSRHPVYASVSTLAIVLAALYILIVYQRTMTGPVTPQVRDTVTSDLSGRERLSLVPLVLLIVVLGVFPKPMLDVIEPAVQTTMQHVGVTDPQPKVSAEGGR